MKRFLSIWLVWIVVLVFAAALAIAYYPLTEHAEAEAEADLQLLVSAAFTRMDIAERDVENVQRAADDTVLGKARAIARFLAHDDTLLDTDALVVLCQMLDIAAIYVTDRDGGVIAASDAEAIGRALLTEADFTWASTTLSDGDELTKVSGTDAARLYGAVARTDTEGAVVILTGNEALATAIHNAKPETVVSGMSFIRDDLAITDEPGDDGAYIMDGYFCLRESRDNVSVVAMRLLGTIYVVRNAVMLMIAICMLICILAAMCIQLLIPVSARSRRSRVSLRHAGIDLPPALDEPDESELARLLAEEQESLSRAAAAEEAEYAAVSQAYGDDVPVGERAAFDSETTVAAPLVETAAPEADEAASEAPRKKKRPAEAEAPAPSPETNMGESENEEKTEAAFPPADAGATVTYRPESPVEQAPAEAAEDADETVPGFDKVF